MKSSQKELYRWANQIPEASWADLLDRSPQHAAEAVGARWDGETFDLTMLGVPYSVDPANRRIIMTNHADNPVSYEAGVVLLTTLTISKGVPPSGRMVVPQELPGGRLFFTGAHAVAIGPLAEYFEKDSDQLLNRARDIGAEIIEGADIAFRVSGLPYVPLYVLLWQGDQEFPARAVIGIDARAHFHLDLAGIWALTNLLMRRLCKKEKSE